MSKEDGGSPLICPLKTDPKKYVQVAIVSWGIKCGSDLYSEFITTVSCMYVLELMNNLYYCTIWTTLFTNISNRNDL
ncbi:uncharacterized protein LOC107981604 [Nasonia vitripennis]|uniref:Peptidase S1 domain-containing protein n=1 Tax=Nasonia vitripennis TaxID=7425 RepID=A0A7M7T6C9_NASVI|nr:uncharacterized protein LOC107981604 [Nasonia vitripennis]